MCACVFQRKEVRENEREKERGGERERERRENGTKVKETYKILLQAGIIHTHIFQQRI